MTGVFVCSLSNKLKPQPIPADGRYHLLLFPFGKRESYDAHGMHQMKQPDGHVLKDWNEPRAGLIWPAHSGWATLTSMIHWEDGDYTQVKDRFVRDPLGLVGTPDSTATQSHPHFPSWLPEIPGLPDLPGLPTKGLLKSTPTYIHGTHQLFVHPGVPLGVMVTHNASRPLRVTHAQFKMCIHPVQQPA